MSTDRELLEDALHVLDKGQWIHPKSTLHDEIRARLAEPEEEPFCYVWPPIKLILDGPEFPPGVTSDIPIIPLYRHPHQPVRLSDEELYILWQNMESRPCPIFIYETLARQIMDAMLEKNQ